MDTRPRFKPSVAEFKPSVAKGANHAYKTDSAAQQVDIRRKLASRSRFGVEDDRGIAHPATGSRLAEGRLRWGQGGSPLGPLESIRAATLEPVDCRLWSREGRTSLGHRLVQS